MDVQIECLCPPNARGETRHPDGDTVTLRERLDFRAALTARNTMLMVWQGEEDSTIAEAVAAATECYVLAGIESWTLVDAKNRPVEVTKAAIRALIFTHDEIADRIAIAADALYAEAVVRPLLERVQGSSPPTPIAESTSAMTDGPSPTEPSTTSPKRPKPSRPSSTTTIPTDVTAKTSSLPAGGSSSSPSLRSAG